MTTLCDLERELAKDTRRWRDLDAQAVSAPIVTEEPGA